MALDVTVGDEVGEVVGDADADAEVLALAEADAVGFPAPGNGNWIAASTACFAASTGVGS